MKISSRSNWIDWTKSIGIMFVIFGHIPMNSDNTIKEIICSFHMPLFFAISGYLHKGTTSLYSSFKKYWYSLIIPYFFFNIIFYPYWFFQQTLSGVNISNISDGLIKPILGVLMGQQIGKGSSYLDLPCIINGVTWFIVALFIIKVVVDLFLRCKKSDSLLILLCLFSALIGLTINVSGYYTTFTFQSVLKELPFFVGGYFLKRYNVFDRTNKYTSLIAFIVLMFFVVRLQKFNMSIDPYHSFFAMLIYYLIGITGILMILFFSQLLNKIHFHFVYIISVGNIVILGFHWMFIGTINYILKYFKHIQNEIIYTTTEAVFLTCFISLAIYPIILFMRKYLSLFIGKR